MRVPVPSKPRYSLDSRRFDMPLFPQGELLLGDAPSTLSRQHRTAYELFYLSKGQLNWEIEGGRRFSLIKGKIALMQPGVLRRGEYDRAEPCNLLWLLVDPYSRTAIQNTAFTKSSILRVQEVLHDTGNKVSKALPEMETLFLSLQASLATLDSGYGDDFILPWIRGLLTQMLICALRSFSGEARKPESEPIARAKAFMEDHIMEDISVDHIASHVGLSTQRFMDLFEVEVGVTPTDYLIRLRCDRARNALVHSSASIAEIAFELGFTNTQLFSSCFRKYTGSSPTQFRNRMRRP